MWEYTVIKETPVRWRVEKGSGVNLATGDQNWNSGQRNWASVVDKQSYGTIIYLDKKEAIASYIRRCQTKRDLYLKYVQTMNANIRAVKPRKKRKPKKDTSEKQKL